jgi:hypothetical protein
MQITSYLCDVTEDEKWGGKGDKELIKTLQQQFQDITHYSLVTRGDGKVEFLKCNGEI